jgi:hypothetical protein
VFAEVFAQVGKRKVDATVAGRLDELGGDKWLFALKRGAE